MIRVQLVSYANPDVPKTLGTIEFDGVEVLIDDAGLRDKFNTEGVLGAVRDGKVDGAYPRDGLHFMHKLTEEFSRGTVRAEIIEGQEELDEFIAKDQAEDSGEEQVEKEERAEVAEREGGPSGQVLVPGGAEYMADASEESREAGELVEKVYPGEGEEKNAYISRCVRDVMGEGKTQDQALGQCFGMWRQKRGSVDKAIPTEGLLSGARVESEHIDAYNAIALMVRRTGRLPPSDVFFALIARDHLAEDPAYYDKLLEAGL